MASSKEEIKTQGQNQKDAVAGATLVSQNARSIIQQGDIKTIKEIPLLPDHQKAAKAQANKWFDKIWPHIIKTTAEVIDYANMFTATYSLLESLIPQLEKGDEDAKKQFVEALDQALIPALQTKKSAASDIAGSIKQFHDKFQPLYTDFQSDFSKADDLMTKDKQEIKVEQIDLKEWNAKADAYMWSAVGLGVALPATAAATAIFSETGVGLIIGGILMVAETGALIAMLTEYADAMQHVNDLTNKIHSLQSQVAQLNIIEKQITGLQKHTQKVVTVSENVANGWLALHDDLQETLAHLKTITPQEASILIKINLLAAKKDWEIVLEQAKTLQPDGGQLKHKNFNTSADMMKAIHDQAKPKN